jgi:tRNA A-37 threonylcarbamoyl transferase component Bud32
MRLLKAELRELYRNKVKGGFTSDLIDSSVRLLNDGTDSKYIDVCMLDGKQVVRKICKSKKQYLRELNNLLTLADFAYTPKVIKQDDENLVIIMEYKGKSLVEMFNKTSDRVKFLPQIKIANDALLKEYGMYHNDLKWKNITILDDVAYLVDVIRTSTKKTDTDSEKIIERIKEAII